MKHNLEWMKETMNGTDGSEQRIGDRMSNEGLVRYYIA